MHYHVHNSTQGGIVVTSSCKVVVTKRLFADVETAQIFADELNEAYEQGRNHGGMEIYQAMKIKLDSLYDLLDKIPRGYEKEKQR